MIKAELVEELLETIRSDISQLELPLIRHQLSRDGCLVELTITGKVEELKIFREIKKGWVLMHKSVVEFDE